MFTHVCVDELLIAAASGFAMGATFFFLAPVLAPVARLGWVGRFFASATEGAIVNSVGHVITNVLSERGWNVGLAQAYRDGYLFGGALGLAGKAIKTWWQAARARPLGIVAPGFASPAANQTPLLGTLTNRLRTRMPRANCCAFRWGIPMSGCPKHPGDEQLTAIAG